MQTESPAPRAFAYSSGRQCSPPTSIDGIHTSKYICSLRMAITGFSFGLRVLLKLFPNSAPTSIGRYLEKHNQRLWATILISRLLARFGTCYHYIVITEDERSLLQSEAEGHAAYLLRLDASTFPLQYQRVYQCCLQTTQYIRTQPLVQHQADDIRLDYQVPSVATIWLLRMCITFTA